MKPVYKVTKQVLKGAIFQHKADSSKKSNTWDVKAILFILIFACSALCLKAQESGIVASSFIAKDRIVLRWAPTDYFTWKQGLKNGYKVDRFILKKGAFGDTSKLVPEHSWTLRSIPIARIKELAKVHDDFASLEGILEKDSSAHLSRLEQINQQDSRFGMALLLADFSQTIAKAQALTLTDSLLPKDAMVGYKISMLGNTSIKPGYLLLNPDEKSGLPKIHFNVIVDNGKVLLKWNTAAIERHYVGYYIERGDTRTTFKRLNSTPFVKFDVESNQDSKDLVFSDTLTAIGQSYYYRIVGLSPFGFEKVMSDTLMATVEDNSIAQINLRSSMPFNKMIDLKWDCPDSISRSVSFWELKKSTDVNGHYKSIGTSKKGATRLMTDKAFSETSYYQLVGLNSKRIVAKSQILRVMLVDTIPPAAPQGLVGTVDRKGKASFSWRSPEPGIKAYNIYRNFQENEKPVPVYSTKDTSFSEQLQPGLSTKVFYYVEAVDERFNSSPKSNPLILVIPDSIPPVPALIRKVIKDKDELQIVLISSSSNDIDHYELCTKEDSLVVLHRFDKNLPKMYSINSDELANRKNILIKTVDKSGNTSVSEETDLSPFIDVNTGKKLASVDVKREKKVYIITISNVLKGMRELKLYASIDNGHYELIKVFPVLSDSSIIHSICDIDKVKSYKIMLVGALSVKPVIVGVK